jgi:hypothetical protein
MKIKKGISHYVLSFCFYACISCESLGVMPWNLLKSMKCNGLFKLLTNGGIINCWTQ